MLWNCYHFWNFQCYSIIKLILNVTLGPYANGIDVIDFAILDNVDYIVVDERLMSK